MRLKTPTVSIIVPVKNEGKLLKNFLKSTRKLNYPQNRIEVIIADGASTDETRQIALKYGAKVVDNPKQTVGPGRNTAFKRAHGQLIGFSDADCLLDQNWLQNSLKYFTKPQVAGVGGPNFTPKEEGSFSQAVGFFMNQPFFSAGSIHGLNLPYLQKVQSLPGCNAIYRREILDRVMPIDESLLTCDDTEMNRKILDLGYKLLSVPDVFVWHHQRPTPQKLWGKMYRWAIGRLQLGKKRKGMINLVHVAAGFSIPIIISLSIVLGAIKPILFLIIIGLIVFALIIFSSLALFKTKSFGIAANLPIVITIATLAWSLGFLRELFFPLKNPIGH